MTPSKPPRAVKTGLALLAVFAGFLGPFLSPATASAQAAIEYTEKKLHALELYRQNKLVEAATELEQLAAVNDRDKDVFAALGFSLYATIFTTQSDQARANLAARARTALKRARELGDKDELSAMALSE